MDENKEAIYIERDGDFYKTVCRVSDFISGLGLNQSDNDRLVALMMELVETCERNAFLMGAEIASRLAVSSADEKQGGFVQ